MELYNYVHSSCTNPTQASACLFTVLVNRIQKSGSGDKNFMKWKRDISARPTKMTRPVKEDHLQSHSRIFRSDQCKQNYRIAPFHLMYQPKCMEFWVEWKVPLDFHLTYLIRVEPLGMPLSRGKTGYGHPPPPQENRLTSFKARFSATSPGANGLKQFTWFAHSDYFSGHHYEFFRKRGGG